MSVKDCGHHHDERKKLVRRLVMAAALLITLLALVIFLVWAILHPTKPRFVLQDVTVYNFTAANGPPYILTSTIQVTLSSKNPNDRIGIYYQKLDVYVTYRTQQITVATLLPSSYQGHHDVTVWSPFLSGYSVPISPYLQQVLSQDLNVGSMLVTVRIAGKVKWKVGSWVSGKYHLDVNCPAYLRFGNPTGGIPVGPALKLQLLQSCHVETALGS
ncbi:Late embryogenesis abundant protein [Trema orientale]|uniref:Late embryogenesis abundant protein n=1 Tax=Trema orientale TaxID=63057 RepID=A0A2P5BEN7_TREOI|nr:Late embryogenesis abundant protein [Trema orientale]